MIEEEFNVDSKAECGKLNLVRNRLVPKWMTLTFCLEVVTVMSTTTSHSPLNISKTVRDRGFPKDHQYEMGYGESNGHVTNYFTWQWKVKLLSLDPNTLRAQYLENS